MVPRASPGRSNKVGAKPSRTRIRLCAGLARNGLQRPPGPFRAQPGAGAASTATGVPKRPKRGGRSNFANQGKKVGLLPDLCCPRRLPPGAGLDPGARPPPRPSDQDRGRRLVLSTGHVPDRGRCAPTGAMQAETAMTMPLAAETAHTSPRAPLVRGLASPPFGSTSAPPRAWWHLRHSPGRPPALHRRTPLLTGRARPPGRGYRSEHPA
jgi:hypothetical protein